MRERILIATAAILACSCGSQPAKQASAAAPSLAWKAAVTTESVADDPDDPAIWIHPSDPSMSLIVGTNKAAAPSGALVVFDLDGHILQTIANLDRPNNVDLRQNVRLGDQTLDIVAVTERNKSALRLYSVDAAARRLVELGSFPVFAGEMGDFAAPMGIALYKRTTDGALFAIVGRKNGPAEGYLWQYRVTPGPKLELVRKFGKYSGSGEIEAIVTDDALGYVYYADEDAALRKYHADPDTADAAQQLAEFGTTGYKANREGLAIYATGEGTGYLISCDQIQSGSRYFLYRREGAAANPHDHSEVVAIIEPGADATDGLEATSTPLGPRFPRGLLATMNSTPKNFLLYAWDVIPAKP